MRRLAGACAAALLVGAARAQDILAGPSSTTCIATPPVDEAGSALPLDIPSFGVGASVVCRGTPLEADGRFALNLGVGSGTDDVALHINPRYTAPRAPRRGAPPAWSRLTSTVHLATSFLDDAQTSGDVFVQLVGSGGSSQEVLAGNGLDARAGIDVAVEHRSLGTLRGVTVRLDGNNGVHLAEVRVEYAFGSAGHVHDYAVFSWILSELNGWLDGDSDKPPSRTFDVASASPAVEGSGTAIVVDTVTGTANHADSGGTFTISFFGSNGHTVPAVLSAGFQAGAADQFAFEVGDIGTFRARQFPPPRRLPLMPAAAGTEAAKITNTGNDGWLLVDLTVAFGSSEPMNWSYNKWLDVRRHGATNLCSSDAPDCAQGNGNSESQPHAEYFYADGTVASDRGFSLSEVAIACPAEVTACQADSACNAELTAATGTETNAEWPAGTLPACAYRLSPQSSHRPVAQTARRLFKPSRAAWMGQLRGASRLPTTRLPPRRLSSSRRKARTAAAASSGAGRLLSARRPRAS